MKPLNPQLAKIFNWSKSDKKNDNDKPICPICLEGLEFQTPTTATEPRLDSTKRDTDIIKETIVELSCSHIMCSDCFEGYVINCNISCPYCRSKFFTDRIRKHSLQDQNAFFSSVALQCSDENCLWECQETEYIPVAFQVAPLLAAFAYPDHLLLRRLTGLRSLAA